jgi:tRNA(fMet)-specific endonuclease VapC
LTFRIAQHPISDFRLSVISFHEQVIGAHSFINRAQNNTDMARGYALLLETLNSFAKAPVLHFDSKAIAIFDEMRTQKVRVATMDLRIAAIAISNNLVLLTRNIGDFNKVPSLIIEDWTV